jgi:hypothetical protein
MPCALGACSCEERRNGNASGWPLSDKPLSCTGMHRALEGDQGEPVRGKAAAQRLIKDWDLDLEALLDR